MEVLIWKARRMLESRQEGRVLLRCPIALGREPVGKYGKSLGLSYPSPEDAARGFAAGRIDEGALDAVRRAWANRVRPPWGTALGGEIYLHEGGTASDWTQGCIALESADMARLFERWQDIETVTILP